MANINLLHIKYTLENTRTADDDGISVEQIDNAIADLKEALAMLETITVKGRDAIDKVFGCILAIEQIIGDTENKGE